MGDACGPTWPTARENVERQIQIKYYKNLTFIKSHVRYQIKAILVVNPANMSDFKNVFWRKHKMLLSDDSTTVNKERKHISTLQAQHKTQK